MRAEKFILRHWWISVILRIRSWNQNIQNNRGRVVLGDDTVKDDSGSHAVFTEQGSSASQMTAAKVMDVTARPPGCRTSSGRSVSLYPGQNGRYPIVIENSKVRMSRYLDTSTKTQVAKNHGPVWKIQSFLLSDICTVNPLAGLFMGKTIRESSVGTRLGKSARLGMFICKKWKTIILACVCGRHKTGWKQHRIDWKNQPRSFVYLGCTQRECETSKDIVDNYKNMFESRISERATEKLPRSGSPDANISTKSYDMENHA